MEFPPYAENFSAMAKTARQRKAASPSIRCCAAQKISGFAVKLCSGLFVLQHIGEGEQGFRHIGQALLAVHGKPPQGGISLAFIQPALAHQ